MVLRASTVRGLPLGLPGLAQQTLDWLLLPAVRANTAEPAVFAFAYIFKPNCSNKIGFGQILMGFNLAIL